LQSCKPIFCEAEGDEPLASFNAAPVFQIPYPLDFAHAHIIVAPVAKAGRLGVRVSGHALRDLDAPAVRQIVRAAFRAERPIVVPEWVCGGRSFIKVGRATFQSARTC